MIHAIMGISYSSSPQATTAGTIGLSLPCVRNQIMLFFSQKYEGRQLGLRLHS